MKFLQEPLTYLFTYFVVLIFTFGHAYVNEPDTYKCFAGHTCDNTPFVKSFESMVASVMWPFYWSVQAQK